MQGEGLSLDWVETEYRFPEPDPAAESYFEDMAAEGPETGADPAAVYGFRTIPELRALLKERLGSGLSDREILETAKNVFRCRPKREDRRVDNSDREVVDFIYHF